MRPGQYDKGQQLQKRLLMQAAADLDSETFVPGDKM